LEGGDGGWEEEESREIGGGGPHSWDFGDLLRSSFKMQILLELDLSRRWRNEMA